MVFSVGGEKQIARHFELRGIREALLLIRAVWKGVLGFYEGKQPHKGFTMFPNKGGRAWSYSAKGMNRRLELILPRANRWTWTDFTANSLRTLYNNRGLFPPDRG